MDDLARRVAELERRVAMLEGARLYGPPFPVVAPVRAPVLDGRLGLTWLNRVGAVVVIAGLALAALWAHEQGYLSPAWRNILGAVVGVALFAVGARALGSSDPARRGFGVGVTAVGAFALYLVPFAAAVLDHSVPRPVAAVAAGVVTLLLALYAARRREVVLALFAAVYGATFALATDYPVALFPLGAIAVGAALVCASEPLFIVGTLLLGVVTSLLLGPPAIPFVAAIGAAGVAELAVTRRWRHALAMSMVLVLGASLGTQSRSFLFSTPFDGTQVLVLVCALAALRAPTSGALDPMHREDPLRLLAYIQVNAIVLTLLLRAVPWDVGRSMVLIVQALALTAIGVARRHVASRALGLALFACALLKAFVMDVWRQDTGVRVLALLALGGGLLGGSYLYSRMARRYAP